MGGFLKSQSGGLSGKGGRCQPRLPNESALTAAWTLESAACSHVGL